MNSIKKKNSSYSKIQFNLSDNICFKDETCQRVVSHNLNDSINNSDKMNQNNFISEISKISPRKYSSSVNKSHEYFIDSKNIIENAENNHNFEPQISTDNTDPDTNSLNYHHLIKSFYPSEGVDVNYEINCDVHTSSLITYWNDETKSLLCDKCMIEKCSNTNTFNLTPIENSTPLILQKIKKTINDINYQNNFLKCKKVQLNYQKESWKKTTEFYQNNYKINFINFQKIIQKNFEIQKVKIENYFENKKTEINQGINILNKNKQILQSKSEKFKVFSSKLDVKDKIKKYCSDIKHIDQDLQNINIALDGLQKITTGKCTAYSESENKILYSSNLLEFYRNIQNEISRKIRDVENILAKEKNNLSSIRQKTSKNTNYINSSLDKISCTESPFEITQSNSPSILNLIDKKIYFENSSHINDTDISQITKNSKDSNSNNKRKKNISDPKKINKKFYNLNYIKNQDPQIKKRVQNLTNFFKKPNESNF